MHVAMKRSIGCALSLAASAWAQTAPPASPAHPPSDITTLQAVTVTGAQPGPGLWKVSRNGHVLYVIGVIPVLPGGMQWRTDEVGDVIAQSQEVILPPKVKLKVDTGFFGKLLLLPSAYSARKNDDGKTLDQILPAALYARWTVLKQKYIGDDRGIERWRPIFAALELLKKALRANGLRNSNQVDAAIVALAKQHNVTQTPVEFPLEIERPREAIKAFRASAPDDTGCFSRTLDGIEHDLPTMRARANAWATGDIAALRALPDSGAREACVSALTEAGFARQLGISDVPQRIQAAWLAAARAALAAHAQSFAELPMDQLLDAGGAIAQLKAAGYTVEAPDDPLPDDAPAAGAAPPATPATAPGGRR